MVLKRIGFLVLLAMLAGGPVMAQLQGQALIDSLEGELAGAMADTIRVNLLNSISFQYAYVDPEEGIAKGQEALALAKELRWLKGVGNAYRSMGSNYANRAEYALALENEYAALKIFEHLGEQRLQAIMLQNIGIVHNRSKNHGKALEYEQKALKLYESLGDEAGVAAIYSNLANVYGRLRDSVLELDYQLRALEKFVSLHDEAGTARQVGNIANFYAEKGDYSQAMVYYFDALRKETALGNENGITRNLGNIGETYLDISRDESGETRPDSLIPAGQAANLAKAIEFLTTCLNSAKEMEQTDYYLAFAETLSEAYRLAGRLEEALAIYREYIVVRDSVYDVEKYNAATRLEMNYEFGKREDSVNYAKHLSDLQVEDEKRLRNQEQVFFVAVLVLVLVFSGFMYNRWRVTQRQKKVIEEEKRRSEELLLNILPAETAKELKETGHSDARMIQHVTVLFTDFQGFTQISETLSPEALVAQINECFSAFDLIMEKYGVEKIKTIGDAYMAAGGLPTTNETHAVDVVRAALEIQQFMQGWVAGKRAANLPYFEIRIGINTGPVVAGIVGIKKFQYDIWGDTVNMASRMESSGEVGKVNISAFTYELVKDRFRCVHRGKVHAKGKGEVDMYFVENWG